MDGRDCGSDIKDLGGAVVYSHFGAFDRVFYRDGIDCRITFKAERTGWRLMLRFMRLDVTDRSGKDICNDAIYIYDGATIFSRAVVSMCPGFYDYRQKSLYSDLVCPVCIIPILGAK